METQVTICEWADNTFGKIVDTVDAVDRASQELKELRNAAVDYDLIRNFGGSAEHSARLKVGQEIADVIIVLKRLAQHLLLPTDILVDTKMEINRERKWKVDGRGHGQHIKD